MAQVSRRGLLIDAARAAVGFTGLSVGAAALAACSPTATTAAPTAVPGATTAGAANPATGSATVPFAYQPGYNYGLFYVAQQKGWFNQVGLTLDPLVIFQQGTVEVDALLSGQFVAGVLGFVPVLTLAAKNQPVRIIDVVDDSGATYAIVSNADVTDVPGLKGKSVGVTLGTNYQYFLDQVLAKYGMKESDLNIVNQQPLDAQAAFIAGRLDAIVPITINTASILNQRSGAKALFKASQFADAPNPSSTPFAIYDLLVTTASSLSQNAATLRNIMQVFHTKVTSYVKDNFDGASSDILNWQQSVVKAQVTLPDIQTGLKGYTFFDVPGVQKVMSGGLLQTSLTSISQYLIGQNLLPAIPDLSTTIDTSLASKLQSA